MSEKIGNTKTDKWANEQLACRKIVNEISKLGVTDEQKLEIIRLLSLELNNHELIVSIHEIVKDAKEQKESSKILF
jgi:hypothetical protein